MALNLSHFVMYSMKPWESEMGSFIGAGDSFVVERKGNTFDLEMEDFYGFLGRDRGNYSGRTRELIANDILDLLPSDPFGMDLSVATFNEIADWLEDFEVGTQLNLMMNRAMAVQWENGGVGFIGEREGRSFGNSQRNDDLEVMGSCGFPGMEPAGEGEGSCKSIANDILDVLPSDPFGMDLSLATFSAIVDWLEDFKMDSRLNLFRWDRAMALELDTGSMGVNKIPNSSSLEELGFVDGSSNGESDSFRDVEEFLSLNDEDSSRVLSLQAQEQGEQAESCCDGDRGAPHDALLHSLGYLELKDLLSAERVCRSFRSAVRDDPLLWRSIHIDQPLSERITDDDLLNLTGRAQGILQSLSLVDCSRITDDGLRRVLECNPRLTKLSVPGCTRLSIGGIVNNLKAFQSKGMPGIKCLRIGGLYGVTEQYFEELKLLLNADKWQLPDARKLQFFHSGYSLSSRNDEWPLDIEMCPRCQKLRLVYDCPVQSCQGKQIATQQCRACTFCIARCVQCGRCVNDSEYEETFCLDLLCLGCQKQQI
ncbi:hypothetical protein MRB53_035033 [Persea americana]|uniref:Uncharacterized protein n=1 Tax=Persea americana TaxID=3435 RepID=A0ACC2K3I8_PERAE|nr:hypothetical protein MRB53_035033 [Persea americana]